MATPKQDAIHALMRAASDCPSRVDAEAFNDYQDRVMEPIRQDIRRAALTARESAFERMIESLDA